jgi:hypothetical protein
MTDCNRIITLGLLDNFTRGLIQDGTGGTVSVNYGDKPETYCPTYSELISGVFIPVYNHSASPNLDTDGIYINGTYANNQCVILRDLEAIYTRYQDLTITANPTSAGACGSIITLGYELKYKRYTKSYANSCTSYTTTEQDVQDAAATVSWEQSPTIGTINYPNFTVSKNDGSGGSSEARTTNLNATVVCRGTTIRSNTIQITQSGLGGSWETVSTTSSDAYSNFILTVYNIPFTGGTASGSITKTTTITTHQRWVDECGKAYSDITQDLTETTSTTEYWTSAITAGNCDDTQWVSGNIYRRHYLPVFYDIPANTEVVQTGECVTCDCAEFSISPNVIVLPSSASTAYTNYSDISCIEITSINYSDSWVQVTNESSNNQLKITASKNENDNIRTSNITVNYSGDGCTSHTELTVMQAGGYLCDCDKALVLDKEYLYWSAASTQSKSVSVIPNDCVKKNTISVSSSDHFSAAYDSSNNTITITPTGTNETHDSIDEIIVIDYELKEGVQSECNKIIHVTQKGKDCGCDDLIFN